MAFDLESQFCEVHVAVRDEEAPVRALVWVDDDRAQAVTTGRDGVAVVVVRRGSHVMHIDASGTLVEHPIQTVAGKQDVIINLAWERRANSVARVLEKLSVSAEEASHNAAMQRLKAGDPAGRPTAPPPRPAKAAAPATAGMTLTPLQPTQNAGAFESAPRSDIFLESVVPAAEFEQNVPTLAEQSGSDALGQTAHAAAPAADKLGRSTLGRYRRLGELGRGGMGVVYRARDCVLDRDVALKILSRAIREAPDASARFLHEAKALASLNHPNIVTIFDQGQEGDDLFLVMELVEGGTLQDRLKATGRLPVLASIDILEQLCAAVAYAHGRRIIHRDIKPANIFVGAQGAVKIGDFGLARAVGAMQISRTQIQGTPLYMSPEQIKGTEIDFRTDIYSLGCTLFELVTGRPPFIDGDVLYHHVHSAPPRASDLVNDVPSQLEDLLAACLMKDKNARAESAQWIAAALKTLRGNWASTYRQHT